MKNMEQVFSKHWYVGLAGSITPTIHAFFNIDWWEVIDKSMGVSGAIIGLGIGVLTLLIKYREYKYGRDYKPKS